MKKTCLLFLLLIMVSTAISQTQKISVEASYGFVSGDRILSGTEDILGQVVTLGMGVEKENQQFVGPVGWTVRYHFSETHAVGLVACYEQSTGDLVNNEDLVVGDFVRQRFVLATEFKLTYLNAKQVQLYGTSGIGYTFGTDEYNYPNEESTPANKQHLAVYFSPFGIRVGNTIGGFFEMGYGYKGIVNMGVSARFYPKSARN